MRCYQYRHLLSSCSKLGSACRQSVHLHLKSHPYSDCQTILQITHVQKRFLARSSRSSRRLQSPKPKPKPKPPQSQSTQPPPINPDLDPTIASKLESARLRSSVPSHIQYEGYNLTQRQRKALEILPPEALSQMKEDALLQELEYMEQNPSPWMTLLRYPSRAAWRSSPGKPAFHLEESQMDLIHRAERTTKQLRRTYDYIISNHNALAKRRERERRSMANHSDAKTDTLAYKSQRGIDTSIKTVIYKPEQTLCSLKFRLVPNYLITRRILSEVQGLIGRESFRPKKIIDVGCGVGSASAAALDHFYEDSEKMKKRWEKKENKGDGEYSYHGVEWVHGIDASTSMRDASKMVLESALNGQGKQVQKYRKPKKKGRSAGVEVEADSSPSPKSALSRLPLPNTSRTRLTFGNQLTTMKRRSKNASQDVGSFDLALCSYTLSELPTFESSLSMAAIVWEKLKPNGVAIFIEPGTPDGFNSLRSVRSMLLDCCPPDDRDEEKMDGDEECHVIAPCTHNGTCPMIRHLSSHQMSQRQKEKEASAAGSKLHGTDGSLLQDENMLDKMMEMMKDKELDDNDGVIHDVEEYLNDPTNLTLDDFIDLEQSKEEEDDLDKNVLEIEEGEDASIAAKEKEADYFETTFCSFVHGMPGNKRKNQGEKFTYLVVQKRIAGDKTEKDMNASHNEFHDTNAVHLLSESFEAAKPVRPNLKKKEKILMADTSRHDEIIDEALDLEDKFLHSDADPLGLELVRGDSSRQSWGRIVRAPIKKKGHVIVDFCAAQKTEEEHKEGKIVRHLVSRKESARKAPGMYGAARKARWGGLWPDVTQRNVQNH